MGAGNRAKRRAREGRSLFPAQSAQLQDIPKNGLASKHDPRMNVMRQNEQQKTSLRASSTAIRETTSRRSGDVEGGIASLRDCLIQLPN
jgi:hypothetical protein